MVDSGPGYRFDEVMKFHLAIIPAVLLAVAPLHGERPQAALVPEADVLPLALSDEFTFKKSIAETFTEESLNERVYIPSRMIEFKRESKLRGALTRLERYERYGQYFTFYWHAEPTTDVTVRFEYRQSKLGDHVQARELVYPEAGGTLKSEFAITGDDYHLDGQVTSWRALLIRDQRIVAMKTSYLWN